MLNLYDTATAQIRPLKQRVPGQLSIYLCGPTVYGPPHIGHGRATLVYDILRRYLEWTGIKVRLVSNITDIDDKIIDRAEREKRPWLDIAQKCETVWFESMSRLGVLRPTEVPRATEYVDQIVGLIAELVAKNAAYTTDDGIYMNTSVVKDYGLLAHQKIDEMLAGGGDRTVFGADQKKHPADFVLWKFSKPGEPAWPSPWGQGRPGWHSECVVMSLELLGEGFDLHCGGADLRFPHHENERAQAVALGKDFAHHWMHNGFVVDPEGEKMSKSLGNVTNLPDLLDRYDARAYRLLLLQTHYRSPVKVGLDNIDASVNALAGVDSFAARTNSLTVLTGSASPLVSPDDATLTAFRAAMNDDLNTPVAVGVMFDAIRRTNVAIDSGDTKTAGGLSLAVREICIAFGLQLNAADVVDADSQAKAVALDAARTAKDFAKADEIRNELQTLGWLVETTKAGTTLRKV